MVSWEEKQRVASMCLDLFRKLDVPELIPELTIEWKKRFTSRLGDAIYAPTMFKYHKLPSTIRIRFSETLWQRASQTDRDETVAHEVCHVIVAYKNYGKPRKGGRRPHGTQWQMLMQRAGYTPQRCHNVDNSDLTRTRKTVKVYCACGTHMVTPQRVQKMLSGRHYRCTKCQSLLSLTAQNGSHAHA